MRPLARCALALTLLCGATAAQTAWTVDDSGGSDFLSLAQAVASPLVLDGDTLLVEAGFYGPFVTGKALTIVGRADGAPPFLDGESRIDGAARATLAGVNLEELVCRQIPGRLAIEDCDIGHFGIESQGITADTFYIDDCAEAVVSNGVFRGKTGDLNNLESPGVHVRNSRVALVNSTIFGGKGGDGDVLGWPGQPGVHAEQGSQVVIAACTVAGGNGGTGDFGFCQAAGAPAVAAYDSTAWISGAGNDLLEGGHSCPSGDIEAIGGLYSTVTVSGVTLSDPHFGPGLMTTGTILGAVPAHPFLFVGGDPSPGGLRRLNVVGPEGATALVFFTLQPLFATPGKIGNGPLWIDVGAPLLMLPLVLAGDHVAVTVNLPLPRQPALAGVTAWVQGFVPQGGGLFLATDPASLVLRF